MIEVAFWMACTTLAYVYVLYPLIVRRLAMRCALAEPVADVPLGVSIIVTAYNEEKGSWRSSIISWQWTIRANC